MTEPKPYIEYADFPLLTPFTEQAIRTCVHRGELVEGVHYFKRGRRCIFKWSAIEEWIERREQGRVAPAGDIVPLRRRA